MPPPPLGHIDQLPEERGEREYSNRLIKGRRNEREIEKYKEKRMEKETKN
jgi:hypothetical protein